jgi:hypothetical protein
MNKAVFFQTLRSSLYKLKMPQQAVDGLNFLLDHSIRYSLETPQLAYVLATSYHETGATMQPVREGFAKTNAGAIAAVTKLHEKGYITRNYALPDKNTGKSYYGRGHVQLTFLKNYEKEGKELGIDLVNNPDLALELEISAKILFGGMINGRFTGERLSFYIKSGMKDYLNARRIVNGTDKAKLIAGYAAAFEKALTQAISYTSSNLGNKEESAKPTGKSPMQSTTNIAAGAAAALPAIQVLNEVTKATQEATQVGRGFMDVTQAILANPALWAFIIAALAAWWIIKERNKKSYELGV